MKVFFPISHSFEGILMTVKKPEPNRNVVFLNRKIIFHVPYESLILSQPITVLGNLNPYSGTWTRTREPGPK